MKTIKLNKKGTYEEIVEYIRNNYNIIEPTEFEFVKIVETNAKMRKLAKFKNVYKYETEGYIKLNDNNHKENLFSKVCLKVKSGYTDFEALGID